MVLTGARRWSLLVTVAAGLLLITLDNSVLYTALPTLTEELRASSADGLWIINAYPLVMAGLLPGAGTLGDRVGRRRMFLIGLLVFGTASLVAAFAPSPAVLIAGRALLAVGAAAMMPATLALIRLAFTDERERNIAIAVWGSRGTARQPPRRHRRDHHVRHRLCGRDAGRRRSAGGCRRAYPHTPSRPALG